MAREMDELLTHFDSEGQERMVDVGAKEPSRREAIAEGLLRVTPAIAAILQTGKLPKGELYSAARIAGILAAKNTGHLIPLAHTLPLEHVQVNLWFDAQRKAICVCARACTTAKTGVEMEALSAATVALLTAYDMLKGVDKGMEIGPIRLRSKSGGKSGHYEVPSLFEVMDATPHS